MYRLCKNVYTLKAILRLSYTPFPHYIPTPGMFLCIKFHSRTFFNYIIFLSVLHSFLYCYSSAYVLHRNLSLSPVYISTTTLFSTEPTTDKIGSIIESIKTLNLLEASELVKRIETTFGVDASAHVYQPSAQPATKSETKVSEDNEDDIPSIDVTKTDYKVTLTSIQSDKRMNMLKVIKELYPNISLKEVKSIMDNLPHVLFEKIKKDALDDVKKKVDEAGGTIEIE